MSDPALHDRIGRWVAAGLIDAEQGARIEAAEAAWRSAPARPMARRGSLVIEALGYLGGALAVIAGFLAVGQLWPDIPVGAEMAFAAAGAAALLGAGAVVRTGRDPAFERLRGVLWLLSAGCVTAFTGLLGSQVWDLDPRDTTLLASSVTAAWAAVLWWRSRFVLQHLALFAALAVLAGAVASRIDSDLGAWAPGLAVWAMSALWAVAADRDLVPPRAAGFTAAGVGLLVGAQLTLDVAAGHLLGLLTVAALLAVGVLRRQVPLLLVGAFGVILFVPQSAVRYLPQSAAAPIAVFAVGLVLLGAALWLARRNRPTAHKP
jgi:hypothetical protein